MKEKKEKGTVYANKTNPIKFLTGSILNFYQSKQQI
jgi:hypothetical protein